MILEKIMIRSTVLTSLIFSALCHADFAGNVWIHLIQSSSGQGHTGRTVCMYLQIRLTELSVCPLPCYFGPGS